jgi:hypothetical protein
VNLLTNMAVGAAIAVGAALVALGWGPPVARQIHRWLPRRARRLEKVRHLPDRAENDTYWQLAEWLLDDEAQPRLDDVCDELLAELGWNQ